MYLREEKSRGGIFSGVCATDSEIWCWGVVFVMGWVH